MDNTELHGAEIYETEAAADGGCGACEDKRKEQNAGVTENGTADEDISGSVADNEGGKALPPGINTDGFAADGEKSLRGFLDLYLKSVAESERLKAELETVKRENAAEELLKNPEFVEKAAADEAVEKAVIERYLKRVAGGGAPVILSGSVGKTPTVMPEAPKTLKEAKRIAEIFFRS